MSADEGAYESGHLRWETPEDVDPISVVDDALVAVGLNGDLLHGSLAQQRGFVVTLNNSIFQISVPYKTEGAQRKVRPWRARQVKVGCSGRCLSPV